MVYWESHVYSESQKKVVEVQDPWIPKRPSLYSLLKSLTIPHVHRIGNWRLSSCDLRSPKEDDRFSDTGVVEALIHAAHPMLPISSYTYDHIPVDSKKNQIRVLDVHPGRGTEPMECSMRRTILGASDAIPYETVSYCWGKDPGKAVILIDKVPVVVTRSAAEVLQRMRSPCTHRTLWIDAICIDQACDEEKSAQVAIMGEIYQNTIMNLVWLGPDHGQANSLTKCLQQLHENMLSVTGSYKMWRYTVELTDGCGGIATNGHSLDLGIDLQPLRTVLSCDWFSRRWVAQEVVLAPSNLCHFGSTSFPFENLLRAAVWVHYNRYMGQAKGVSDIKGSTTAQCLWTLTEQMHPIRHGVSLVQAWSQLGQTEVSNEADRVYALLGLLQTRYRGPTKLIIDYTLSSKQVFCSATRAMVQQSGASALQHIETAGDDHSQRQPSWMFTFDRGNECYRFLTSHYNANLKLRSDNADHSGPSISDPNVLTLRGFCLDEVVDYTAYLHAYKKRPDPRAHMPFLIAVDRLSKTVRAKSSVSERDRRDDMANTLVAGISVEGFFYAKGSVLRYFNAYRAHVLRTGDTTCHRSRNAIETATADARMYSEASCRACEGRRYFVTRDGRMGLGPRNMLKGDVIAVVLGSKLPLVLRRVKGKRYTFVGAAYVHGIMHGEATRAHQESMEPFVDFDLV